MRRLLLFALVAAPAFASDTYPPYISTKYGIDPIPEQCALCHTGGITGTGTVNTPFGKTARGLGLTSGNDTLLGEVLDQMDAQKTDSDGDGVSDIDELRAYTDPNKSANTPDVPTLKFGCGATVVPEVVFGAALLLLRRRRKTS